MKEDQRLKYFFEKNSRREVQFGEKLMMKITGSYVENLKRAGVRRFPRSYLCVDTTFVNNLVRMRIDQDRATVKFHLDAEEFIDPEVLRVEHASDAEPLRSHYAMFARHSGGFFASLLINAAVYYEQDDVLSERLVNSAQDMITLGASVSARYGYGVNRELLLDVRRSVKEGIIDPKTMSNKIFGLVVAPNPNRNTG